MMLGAALLVVTIVAAIFILIPVSFWIVGVPQHAFWRHRTMQLELRSPGPIRVVNEMRRWARSGFSRLGAGPAVFLLFVLSWPAFVAFTAALLSPDRFDGVTWYCSLAALPLCSLLLAAYIEADCGESERVLPELPQTLVERLVERLLESGKADYAILILSGMEPRTAARYLALYLENREVRPDWRRQMIEALLDLENMPELSDSTDPLIDRLYEELSGSSYRAGLPGELRTRLTKLYDGLTKPSGRVKLFLRDVGYRLIALLYWFMVTPFFCTYLAIHWAVTANSGRASQFLSSVRLGQFGKPFTLYRLKRASTRAEPVGILWKIASLLDLVNLQTPLVVNVIKGNMNFLGPLPLFHVQHKFLSENCQECLEGFDLGDDSDLAAYKRLLIRPGLMSAAMVESFNLQLDHQDSGETQPPARASTHCCNFAQSDLACIERVLHHSAWRVVLHDLRLLWRGLLLSVRFSRRLAVDATSPLADVSRSALEKVADEILRARVDKVEALQSLPQPSALGPADRHQIMIRYHTKMRNRRH